MSASSLTENSFSLERVSFKIETVYNWVVATHSPLRANRAVRDVPLPVATDITITQTPAQASKQLVPNTAITFSVEISPVNSDALQTFKTATLTVFHLHLHERLPRANTIVKYRIKTDVAGR